MIPFSVRPLQVRITNPHRPILAGVSTEFQCKSFGSRPPARITWYLSEKQIVSQRDSIASDGNITYSIVTVIPHASDNGRYLKCSAINQLIPDYKIETGRTLEVYCKFLAFLLFIWMKKMEMFFSKFLEFLIIFENFG